MGTEQFVGQEPQPLFKLGQVVATPGAIALLLQTGDDYFSLLARHVTGDWGDLGETDKQANTDALTYDNRIVSAYELRPGEKLWIITEWDRSVTTLLRPDEY